VIYLTWPTLQSIGTPLHLAAWKGHLEIVDKLLEAGALVDATDKVSARMTDWVQRHERMTGWVRRPMNAWPTGCGATNA
jgi:hypothetical protein